jgi:hypothetical protein
MNGQDIAKLVALAVAIYGAYSAWQKWERKEDFQHSLGLVAAGASVFTALHKL